MTVITVVVSVVTCTIIDIWVGDEVWVSLEFVGDLIDTMYHSLQQNSVRFFFYFMSQPFLYVQCTLSHNPSRTGIQRRRC
jgi:hypothetical protein